MYLFFDTETTGVPAGGENVHLVELGWVLTDDQAGVCASASFIVRPDGFTIPEHVVAIHGISTARANTEGCTLGAVVGTFAAACQFPVRLVGHNTQFDLKIMHKEFERLGWKDETQGKDVLCTMRASADICDIRPSSMGGKVKPPKLHELYRRLFPEDEDYEERHQAMADTLDMMKCFWELRRMGVM